MVAQWTGLMLVAGTIVTGTGPLAGTTIDSPGHRSTVPRFHLTLQDVTQLHADIGWFLGAPVVALVIGMRYGKAAEGNGCFGPFRGQRREPLPGPARQDNAQNPLASHLPHPRRTDRGS